MSSFLPGWPVTLLGKVLVPVSVMFVLLSAGTLWLVNEHISAELRADARRTLATADSVFRNSEKLRLDNLVLRFRGVPNEPRFKAVTRLNDPSTLRVLLTELMDEFGVEAVLFTGQDGEIQASVTRGAALTREELEAGSLEPIRHAAATREPQVDLVEAGRSFFDMVSVPSSIGGQFEGVLTFGVDVGQVVTREFKRLADADLILLSKGRIVSSTLAGTPPKAEELALALADPTCEVNLGGDAYLATHGRLAGLNGGGGLPYILLSSYQHHLEALRSMQRRIALIGLGGVLLGILILWPVILGVTHPLRKLKEAAEAIRRGDLSRRVPITSRDECGALARVFNEMVGNLDASRQLLQEAHDQLERRVQERTAELSEEIRRRERAQQEADSANEQLLTASHQAGMAEVATSVLHNVGNVLNSVNASVSVVTETLTYSRVEWLRKSVELLQEHRDDLPGFLVEDPKGRTLPGFLAKISAQLELENASLRHEMKSIVHHVDHIKSIVTAQQNHAKVIGLIETLDPRALIEDALRLKQESLERHGIRLEREFVSDRPVMADRHKVLQILVNLLGNAKQAILDSGLPGRRIVVRVAAGAPGRMVITVTDTGSGISAENLTKLFRHGFTTKKDGHGFGLHASVLAAREMKGDLTAHSDGPGRGASFSLEVPESPAAAAPATRAA